MNKRAAVQTGCSDLDLGQRIGCPKSALTLTKKIVSQPDLGCQSPAMIKTFDSLIESIIHH